MRLGRVRRLFHPCRRQGEAFLPYDAAQQEGMDVTIKGSRRESFTPFSAI